MCAMVFSVLFSNAQRLFLTTTVTARFFSIFDTRIVEGEIVQGTTGFFARVFEWLGSV